MSELYSISLNHTSLGVACKITVESHSKEWLALAVGKLVSDFLDMTGTPIQSKSKTTVEAHSAVETSAVEKKSHTKASPPKQETLVAKRRTKEPVPVVAFMLAEADKRERFMSFLVRHSDLLRALSRRYTVGFRASELSEITGQSDRQIIGAFGAIARIARLNGIDYDTILHSERVLVEGGYDRVFKLRPTFFDTFRKYLINRNKSNAIAVPVENDSAENEFVQG